MPQMHASNTIKSLENFEGICALVSSGNNVLIHPSVPGVQRKHLNKTPIHWLSSFFFTKLEFQAMGYKTVSFTDVDNGCSLILTRRDWALFRFYGAARKFYQHERLQRFHHWITS